MTPVVLDGWLIVPYEGEEKTTIELGYSNEVGKEPEVWHTAYLDYHEEQRVAKIPEPVIMGKTYQLYFRVNGIVRKAGKISV